MANGSPVFATRNSLSDCFNEVAVVRSDLERPGRLNNNEMFDDQASADDGDDDDDFVKLTYW